MEPQELQANIHQQEQRENIIDETEISHYKEGEVPKQREPEISLEQENNEEKYKPVSILVPWFIDPGAFNNMRKEIFKQRKVRSTIITAKNMEEYTHMLEQEQNTASVDIILISTDYLNSFQDRGVHIPFKTSIASFFHPLFQEFIEHEKTSLIPFALDPLVLFHTPDMLSTNIPVTLAQVQKQLSKQKESDIIPFAFGINADNINQFQSQNFPYPQYFWFLSIIIEQAKQNKSTYILDFFMDIEWWDMSVFQQKVEKISDAWCSTSPRLCLLSMQQVRSSPWRLSDEWRSENIFSYNIQDHYMVNNFPLVTEHYPAKGRWFIINKKSTNITAAGEWIKGYLDVAEKSDGSLRKNTFSAFNSHFQRQKIETHYLPLAPFFKDFNIITWWLDDIQQLMTKSNFLPMLDGTYNKVIFLREEIEKEKEELNAGW